MYGKKYSKRRGGSRGVKKYGKGKRISKYGSSRGGIRL